MHAGIMRSIHTIYSYRFWTHPTATIEEKTEAAQIIRLHIARELRVRIKGPVIETVCFTIPIKRRAVLALLGPGEEPATRTPAGKLPRYDTHVYPLSAFQAPYFDNFKLGTLFCRCVPFCLSYACRVGDGTFIKTKLWFRFYTINQKTGNCNLDEHGNFLVMYSYSMSQCPRVKSLPFVHNEFRSNLKSAAAGHTKIYPRAVTAQFLQSGPHYQCPLSLFLLWMMRPLLRRLKIPNKMIL